MPTTPNCGFRYPITGDSPNGPLEIENLALDVDAYLQAQLLGRKPILVPKPAQTGFGTMAAGQTVTIASYAIPDPGWPFHIKSSCMVDYGSGVSLTALQLSINVDSTVYDTNSITRGHGTTFVANVNTDVNADCELGHSKDLQPTGYTGGAHTLYLVAKAGAALTVYNGPTAGGGNGGDKYVWFIEIVPAS